MSLLESSQPQSAPGAAPAADARPAPGNAAPAPAPTTSAAPAEGLTAPAPGQEKMGGNGGPDTSDWRVQDAGDDTKVLERLARYKSRQDVAKALVEAQTKLSERAQPLDITDQSTPEQIAEYRKALDVPDVPQEAKDAAYAEAYGIKAPDGYEMSQVEQAYLGQFAKKMNSAHVPKRIVQRVVTEHFEMQKALAVQAEQVAAAKQKEWTNALRDELGSREYEAQKESASQWIRDQFRDDPDAMTNILNARMLDGGRLGDSPWFFKLIAEKAMGSGYTDRIMANSMEAGGKPLAQQQAEIEALQFKDPAAYNAAAAPGGKLDKIIAARIARGELDEHGNENRRRRAS